MTTKAKKTTNVRVVENDFWFCFDAFGYGKIQDYSVDHEKPHHNDWEYIVPIKIILPAKREYGFKPTIIDLSGGK